jgi:hypothetical protein
MVMMEESHSIFITLKIYFLFGKFSFLIIQKDEVSPSALCCLSGLRKKEHF